ncbi:MAG: hypothetical protein LC772_02470, partial [Chloroflexi bacterium]|nr:hypothetical protein [Chloroflexota bacterium]
WWNTAPLHYSSPREALFEQLGLARDAATGVHTAGKGLLIYDPSSPAALTYQADGADHLRSLAQQACKAAALTYRETNYLALRRGPYVAAAGLDESLPGDARALHGHFIDLFDARLPIRDAVSLTPGSRFLLLDLDRLAPRHATVVAAACKILGEKAGPGDGLTFYAEAPDKTTASVRLWLPAAPHTVTVDRQPLAADAQTWDPVTKTLLIRFPNTAKGQWVTIG